MLILLCEQNDELRSLAEEVLRADGFEVKAVATLDLALACCRSGAPFACALLDVHLKEDRCLAVAQSIRQIRNLPLILSSGRGDLSQLAEACLVRWVLPKPYDLESLVEVVRMACGIQS